MLPHGYPFRLLDRRADGSILVSVSSNAAQVRGEDELPAFLGVELLAQAALFALGDPTGKDGTSESGLGLLAGVQEVQFHAPLRPGDRLSVAATMLARLGPLAKVRAELRRGDELVVEGELMLAMT